MPVRRAEHRRSHGRHRWVPAAVAGLLLLTLGAGLIERSTDKPVVHIVAEVPPPGAPVTGAAAPGRRTAGPSGSAKPLSLPASRPTRVAIPAAGVDAPVRDLGLNTDGTLEVPPFDHADQVGWYRNGPTPGETGPAVMVGHYDTTQGPAVFHRLPGLKPGERILVSRQDGTTAVFRITRLVQYPKTAFPTAMVYGDTGDAELRLITCGGTIGGNGHWTDNVIVFAALVAR